MLPAADPSIVEAGAGGPPLINRANILLSTSQFNEVSKLYSKTIGSSFFPFPPLPPTPLTDCGWHVDQSPTDYLLYYKCATTLHSLHRYSAALEDYGKVLSLTSQTFYSVHLSKARIHLEEGRDADAIELEKDLDVGEKAREQVEGEKRAELWSACIESSTRALGVASFWVEVRAWRVECSFTSGDLEGSAGD
ncbi:hypothetical protein BDQ17DRAFT_1428682 [Cyathus striatus]|nr:hypothetical protein BDQ17DRAFT_1428682 [Cyathus striatus]